jgi:hypothetical protein
MKAYLTVVSWASQSIFLRLRSRAECIFQTVITPHANVRFELVGDVGLTGYVVDRD